MILKGPIKVIGCGLIGTSLAMRLSEEGFEISLQDTDAANLQMAKDLTGAGSGTQLAELVIVATPPEAVFEVIQSEFSTNPAAVFIDVGGIKSDLLVKVDSFPDIAKNFISVHPMAGREISGPESARADLFESRAWIISKSEFSSTRSLELSRKLGELMGSSIYEIDAVTHDSVVATISHLPQILSSALGASLAGEDSSHLNLAGQGLRDVSRLADSDPQLWSSLLTGNAKEVLPKLSALIDQLSKLSKAIEAQDRDLVRDFIVRGRQGRALIPGKHGMAKRDYTFVPIVIDDKPGGLARIFNECAAIEVNVEDLSMEHSPGQAVGLITLALSEIDAIKLQKHLVSKGWIAHEPRKH